MENERADAGRDGRTRLTRPNSQSPNGDREKTVPLFRSLNINHDIYAPSVYSRSTGNFAAVAD